MGHTHERYQTIRTDLGVSGVDMSGARIRTEESSLWSMNNCEVDQRGVLRKRSKYLPIGNPIMEPTDSSFSDGEVVSKQLSANPLDWKTVVRVPDNAHVTPHTSGTIAFYSSTNSLGQSGEHTIIRMVKDGELRNNLGDTAHKDYTVGFSFRSNELFRIPITGDAVPGLHLSFSVYEDFGIKFGISNIGIYFAGTTGPYYQIPGTANLDDGRLHTVEVRAFYTESGTRHNFDIYLDGVLIDGSFALTSTTIPAGDGFATIGVINAHTLPTTFMCTGLVTNLFLRDNAVAPTEYSSIEAVFSRRKYRADDYEPDLRVYAATKKSLWFDEDMSGIWRFAGSLPHVTTHIADFRDTLILLSSGKGWSTTLTQLGTDFSTRTLDDAPNIRFASTYANRLWGAGDSKYPMRLYFSADRDPNSWFSPDTDADGQESIDEVLGAGYFELQGDSGDSITAVYGDFMGSIIAATRTKLFRIIGNSLDTWQMQLISSTVGALGPDCVELVANDLWLVGDSGITSLRGIQEYGDVATKNISGKVQGLFTRIGTKPAALTSAWAADAKLVYDRTRSEVMLVVPKPEEFDDAIYTFRLASGQWIGPNNQDVTSLGGGYIGAPAVRGMLRGSSDGVVAYSTTLTDTECTSSIESQVLNGRSVSPIIVGMEKTWRNLRIIANPTGYWPITISVKVEDHPWEEVIKYLAPTTSHLIGSTWTVDASAVEDVDKMHIIDFRIDHKGKTLKYKISCDEPEFALVAVEVEFDIDGFEKGD